MKYEALMQRGEAQVKEGNTASARVLFDLAQSAAPDAETRTEVRERGAELGLYGEPASSSEPDVFVSGGKYDDGPDDEAILDDQLRGVQEEPPSGSVRDWDGDPEEVKRRLEEAEGPDASSD